MAQARNVGHENKEGKRRIRTAVYTDLKLTTHSQPYNNVLYMTHKLPIYSKSMILTNKLNVKLTFTTLQLNFNQTVKIPCILTGREHCNLFDHASD